MKEDKIKPEIKEDATKYGEFISSFFEWKTLKEQKERVEKIENITKKEENNRKNEKNAK